MGEKVLLSPEIVRDTNEKNCIIRERLKVAQDRQKRYVNKRRRELEFQLGEKVFLQVSPWKGLLRFGERGKLSPRYIGPYEILKRVGVVVYRLALLPELSKIHNVFHVFMLRKYVPKPIHILWQQPIQLNEDLSYQEGRRRIIDVKQQVLYTKTIPWVKVHWKNHSVEEAT
ncbi:uncharacterized protein LOC123205677 [Mangifera indica]|uniref:uncharacterized protein LOC123205677 n=1 Tax=Mangifera indica TaxID=29780 RepID=UPI001CF965BD|nr:uncharacterized protein LOC123205677 [Mangifera indica]